MHIDAQTTDVVIYHSPKCGTSRNTLAMIRNAGVEPHVIEYLKTPPSRDLLVRLAARAGLPLKALLREKDTPFAALGLGRDDIGDAQLLDAIAMYPILINRPLVVTVWGVRLCRPSEVVLDILPLPQCAAFRKEDGEPIIDTDRSAILTASESSKPESTGHMTYNLQRRLSAEALGTSILVATVVGSGIMAAKLAGGNMAVALLGNTIPTGAILFVLITIFGPVSGAHFNPAVSLVMAWRGDLKRSELLPYTSAQIVGGCAGTIAAHGMFGLTLLQASTTARTGGAQWFAEFVAAFGLLVTIIGCVRMKSDAVPTAVGLYITAAYWFTASTSFANPAVTIARALSDTFAGINPWHVPAFIVVQVVGALAGAGVAGWLWSDRR